MAKDETMKVRFNEINGAHKQKYCAFTSLNGLHQCKDHFRLLRALLHIVVFVNCKVIIFYCDYSCVLEKSSWILSVNWPGAWWQQYLNSVVSKRFRVSETCLQCQIDKHAL